MTSTSLVTRRPAYITIEYTWMKCKTALSVVFLGCGAQDSVVIPRGRSSTSASTPVSRRCARLCWFSGGPEFIAKPLKLERNFRSHTGNLNVAAMVLDYMFDAFLESAVLIAKD